jgi:exodeoxyribonuclease-3
VRIVTFNANGLRAAARKGFFAWFADQDADVLCVQELKAQTEQLAGDDHHVPGYERFLHTADRPGYSGVALYCRAQPLEVVTGLGVPEFDAEGRYVEARFADVAVASVYFPSGSSSPLRQEAKFRFLAAFDEHLARLRAQHVPYVFCGDLNIAHKEIDLKNSRANRAHPGFTPEERAWLDTLFDGRGFIDCFRAVNPEPDQYTWWSNRGRAYEKNVGWRIDYQIASPCDGPIVRHASIYRNVRFSDHAPLIVDYDLKQWTPRLAEAKPSAGRVA